MRQGPVSRISIKTVFPGRGIRPNQSYPLRHRTPPRRRLDTGTGWGYVSSTAHAQTVSRVRVRARPSPLRESHRLCSCTARSNPCWGNRAVLGPPLFLRRIFLTTPCYTTTRGSILRYFGVHLHTNNVSLYSNSRTRENRSAKRGPSSAFHERISARLTSKPSARAESAAVTCTFSGVCMAPCGPCPSPEVRIYSTVRLVPERLRGVRASLRWLSVFHCEYPVKDTVPEVGATQNSSQRPAMDGDVRGAHASTLCTPSRWRAPIRGCNPLGPRRLARTKVARAHRRCPRYSLCAQCVMRDPESSGVGIGLIPPPGDPRRSPLLN